MASSPGRARVALADGKAVSRAELRLRLSNAPHIHVVGEAGNAGETLALVREEQPDVLLLDLHLPPAGALDMLASLALVAPAPVTIVVVPDAESTDAARLVSGGARGVVLRETEAALLAKCVTRVQAGEYWISRDQVGALAGRLRAATDEDEARRRFASLSTRELAIVGAVVRGEANKEIAERLGLSPQTVKNHLSNIFLKVGVASRLELALAALHVSPVFAALLRRGDAVDELSSILPRAKPGSPTHKR